MTVSQPNDEVFASAWVKSRLEGEAEEIEFSGTAEFQMEQHSLSIPDILHVLRDMKSFRRLYSGGCYVAVGADVDGDRVAVVVAPPSEKNRLRIVNAWRGEA